MLLRSLVVSLCTIFPTMMQSQNFSFGTAIVVLRTSDAIYVAADSKIVTPSTPTTECKIRFEGEAGYAMAGIFAESSSDFDLIRIVQKVCSTNKSLTEKFVDLENTIRGPLISAMNKIYHHPSSPPLDHLGAQVALFGFVEKTPYVYRLTFDAIANGSDITDVRIKRMIIPDDKNNEPFALIFLAQSQDVIETLSSARSSFKDWREALSHMIQLAIEKNPDSVGPPVDIVEMRSEGRKWLQKKAGCPE